MENVHKRSRVEARSYANNRNNSQKRRRFSQSETISMNKSKLNAETSVYVFDSGAYTIKLGHTYMEEPSLVPNCIMKAKSERKRPFIGDQIEDCRDLSGLYYLLPCEKGYIAKWDVQKPVWDYVLQRYPIDDAPLIMTQPLYNFRSIQECIDEIFFEEYEVKSMYRANPTDFARYEYVNTVKGSDTSCILIDSGYSFTHVVPYINSKKYYPGIVRIPLGGKLLTNYLKDIISYRQLHVMEETYVINQVKEDACFVSENIKRDMKVATHTGDENTIVKNYVLPDFNNVRRGYIQEPGLQKPDIVDGCQILRLNNERFTVPELLIHPSNIGMESMGIAEAVVKCILSCPFPERSSLSENIVLFGGNSQFPGYKQRLYTEIRSLLPAELNIAVYKPENGVVFPWIGGKSFSKDPLFQSMLVSRYEYEEYGSQITYKKFNDWTTAEADLKEEVEIKPSKISLLQNMKGVNIFGKIEDDTINLPKIETPAAIIPEATRKPVNDNKLINVELKNKLFAPTAFHLENLQTGLKLCNGTTILPENLAIRFIPISEVCLNGTAFLTPANIKFV